MVRTARVGRSPRGRNPSIRVQIPASPYLPLRIGGKQAEFPAAARPSFPPSMSPHAGSSRPGPFPFSDPGLAGLELRSDQAEESRHGQVESIGLLPERLESAIVEGNARLFL